MESPRQTTHHAPHPGLDPAEEPLLDLSQFRVLWHRRYIIILSTIVFMALGIFQARRTAPVYTSDALLKYEPAMAQPIDFGERSSMIYQRDELRTAVQLIRTQALAERVLDAIGSPAKVATVEDRSPLSVLKGWIIGAQRKVRSMIVSHPTPQGDPDRLSRQGAARGLLNNLSVYQRPDTKLIEVRVSMNSPSAAEQICREFCEQFIKSVNEQRRDLMGYNREYLRGQIDETKVRLEEAEQVLFAYGGQADIRVIEEAREIAITAINTLYSSIMEQRNEIALLEAESDIAQAEPLAMARLSTDQGSVVRQLLDRRNELVLRQAAMEAENSENFPPLRRLLREISEVQRQIDTATISFIETWIAGRNAALATAGKRLEALEARLKEDEQRLYEIEERMIRFRVLQRDVDGYRTILNALLDQFNRIDAVSQSTLSNVSIESTASIPVAPSSPNVSRILMSFSGFGFLLGVGLVMLWHRLDRSVRDFRTVESTLHLVTLGHVPFLRDKARRRSLFPQKARNIDPISPFDETINAGGLEAFRYLRTSLDYAAPGLQVLLVTSSHPSEGKSTISANLAASYAERGRRTLLIDADLKRPSQHSIFNVARIPGLSDVVAGAAKAEETIRRTRAENLDLLTAGLPTPSTTTLLESGAMAEFLAEIRDKYDVIIIDTCPADALADALVLATRVDGVLITVRHGHTPMDALRRVTEKMRTIGAPVMGVVYNETDKARIGPYYSSGYYRDYA